MPTYILNFVAADQGGALTYATNFCRALASDEFAQAGDEDRADGASNCFIVLLCDEGHRKGSPWAPAEHVEYRVYGWPKRSSLHRLWFDRVTVRRLGRKLGATGLYSQLFAIPGFKGRQVLNLRNSTYFSGVYRQRYSAQRSLGSTLRFWLRRRWTRRSIGCADCVVAPTQAMLDEVAGLKPAGKNQTWRAVHHGFDAEAFLSGQPLDADTRSILEAVGPGWLKLLYVSAFCEHKNVDTLFDAFEAYRRSGGKAKLLVTFTRERLHEEDARAALESYSANAFRDDILFLGRVPWLQIHNVYAACDLFVFPSYLESFGFPMVEAMASGMAVVAAATPVNREVCADAAVFFDTFDAEALARVLTEVSRDANLRSSLSAKALARSKAFSWRTHVRQIVELLDGGAE